MSERNLEVPIQEYMEVEFRTGRLGYYQNTQNLPIAPEDLIIVEVERGEDIAQVTHLSVSGDEIGAQLPQTGRVYRIRRVATELDLEKLRNLPLEEEKAAQTYADILSRYSFEMKLIETIYQFDGNKLTFFFTAEGRIDFRVFVRELANVFRTRIELHQTTGRDEAKRLGGYGMCGLQYCCGNFLKRFNQVTIKMAKDQNLAGNLAKISGPCGRLLCCLNFEEDFYVEESRGYPIPGTCVELKGKRMYVFKTDVLNQRIHLSDEDQSLTEVDLESFQKLKVISVPDIEPC
ncbi:MAG TPA: regulatory iron-sulfur-containing complex subunit RicT [Candidatus Syntrophosphaera sp.]|nr:regulatory iron-sulfur-containing complex subunit RicT [Candidatus Syntrophosphaera sp.]HPH61390.1 regulatory iron-sulfur-containing complex subunit RicT [Candidatus Syntrophosphaera sp.]